MKNSTKKKLKPNNRKVPFKNYIILLSICFVTLLIVFSVSLYYRRMEAKNLETPVISGVLSEITKEDIDTYIIENPDFYLYIGSATNYNSREVEKELIEYFETKHIKDETIYLNVSNENNLEKFFSDFNKKYSNFDYAKLEDYPAFIIIRDGKIMDLVQKKDDKKLTISDIDRVIDEYSY